MKTLQEIRDELCPKYTGETCSSTRVSAWNEGFDSATKHLSAEIERLKETISYLPKVPTEPYEKELAKAITAERLRSEKLLWALRFVGIIDGLSPELWPTPIVCALVCNGAIKEYEDSKTE